MKFGVFYEHQLPRPWTEHGEYELLQNSLDQVELADKLGYDYAWEVEHHFLEEYSHSSAPEVFLAAASQRTKRIRLAHGIIQLTTNHPARVAERVSTLDLISHGLFQLGLVELGEVGDGDQLVGSDQAGGRDLVGGRVGGRRVLGRNLDVGPGHSPAGTGALDRAQVDLELLGQPSDQGRVQPFSIAVPIVGPTGGSFKVHRPVLRHMVGPCRQHRLDPCRRRQVTW